MIKIENRNLTEVVYEKIMHLIDTGVLVPGQRINKVELADLLGVSQTPVNEALSRLSGEMFLEQKNRIGYFVRIFTDEELAKLFEVRAALEGMAVRDCILYATDEELDDIYHCFDAFDQIENDETVYEQYIHTDKRFHELVIKNCRNSYIQDFAASSGYHIKSNQKGLIRPPHATLPEHKAIITAIKARDAENAHRLMLEHFLKTSEALRQRALHTVIT